MLLINDLTRQDDTLSEKIMGAAQRVIHVGGDFKAYLRQAWVELFKVDLRQTGQREEVAILPADLPRADKLERAGIRHRAA